MKKILLISILYLSFGFIYSQSQEYNYVKSTTYLTADTSESVVSVSYADGLGRPLQNIVIGASPSGKDIVQTYRYDNFGRRSKSYMPFTNNGGQNGDFVNNALNLQASFYQNLNIAGGDIPYAEAEYDNSPYNRIIKQSSPGEDINNIYISSEYTPAGGLEIWEINENNQLIKNGIYPANSLIKFTLKDADNKQTFIYKDKSGKILLKEQENTKTRYVYDKFGQLRYVLSPEAVNRMTGSNYTENSDLVKKYCYFYEYNGKHQLVKKQLPGKEPVYLRYDSLYRLRATQDGNQRLNNQWIFINYDKFGRTVSSGLGQLDNDTVFQDTTAPPPTNGISAFLTYQYYDNYDFINDTNLQFDTSLAYHEKFDRIKGKATGSKVRVMQEETEKWLTSVIYYDKYGRVIQSITQNNVGGYDIVSNKYNFAGELLESKQKHTDYNKQIKYLVYLYEYDAVGRLLKLSLSQNQDASNAIIINEPVYNELGQVKQKKIHSENGTDFLQTVDYAYNIKGAITKINDPENLGDDLFALKLYYNETVTGQNNTVYKDGKISAVQWNSKNLNQVQTYMYQYDDLNRLTNALFTPDNKYSVNYEYDLNGNITSLNRRGEIMQQGIDGQGNPIITQTFGIIDSLTYSYNGNRLLSVNDAAGDFNASINNDFRDHGSFASEEYTYDANGNMTQDKNKGINLITYNHLNQPVEVQLSDNNKTVYTYTATGGMLKTEIYEDGNLKSTTDYCGAYVYENNTLSYINIPGGRIVNNQSSVNNGKALTESNYQYNLTDQLGNVRVTFTKDTATGNAIIIQEDHYYPFGMRMSGQHFTNTDLINKFLYNGKELQEQTNYYDYGFRQLDPALGRWHVPDAMAEKYMSSSPYAYVGNNPINHTDLLGLTKQWQNPDDFNATDRWLNGSGISSYIAGLTNGFTRSGSGVPTSADIQDYNNLPEGIRKKMSLGQWWGKQIFALAETGLTRQEAIAAGYTFTLKYRRKFETLTYDYSPYDDEDPNNIEQPLSEIVVINEAYFELGDVWFGKIETGENNSMYASVRTTKRKMNHKETRDYIHSERKRYSETNSIASNLSFLGGGSIGLIVKSTAIGFGIGAPLQLVQQQSSNATDGFNELDLVYDSLNEQNGLYMVHKTINVFPPGMTAPSASYIIDFYLPSGQLFFSINY